MSIFKIGEVVRINGLGNDDYNGLYGVVTKIELSSDHISIFYLVEFQTNSPPPMLIFLENELEAS
ncbi:MAG TPA: hypothetical protein VFC58_10375 [Desulfosporosinus sp.]|nr:hypothetical protein [Desulfosporosinus sp.]